MIKISERMHGFIKVFGNEPIFITECYRCFGGLIVFKKKDTASDEHSDCGLMVYHIKPCNSINWIGLATQAIIKKASHYLDFYDATAFYRCGGKIDTKENERHYKFMKQYLEHPIKSLFPNIPLLGTEPNKKTDYSTILFDDNQKVICQNYETEKPC